MSEFSSPCGAWRLTVRRLGTTPEPTDEIVVIARIEAGGTMTVLTGGPAGEPRLAGWRPAGPRRVVLVAEWFVRDAAARAVGWVSVTAAAELSASGRTCRARLQWHHVDLAGEFGNLGAQLVEVRRHEMDHALQPHRQLAQRRRRADGQGLKELARKLHGLNPFQNLGLPFRAMQRPRQVGQKWAISAGRSR